MFIRLWRCGVPNQAGVLRGGANLWRVRQLRDVRKPGKSSKAGNWVRY